MKSSLAVDVYRTVRYAHHELKKDVHNKLAENGITWPQFHALYHIGEKGIPSHELAKQLHCNPSNITGLLDRMIENNWVYREHCEDDRRVWLIKPTEEGIKLKTRLLPRYQKNIEDRMEALDEQELVTLKALLDKLIKG